jgi:hypothetical protein
MWTRDLTSTVAVPSTARVGVIGNDAYCVRNYVNSCIIEQIKQVEVQKLCQKSAWKSESEKQQVRQCLQGVTLLAPSLCYFPCVLSSWTISRKAISPCFRNICTIHHHWGIVSWVITKTSCASMLIVRVFLQLQDVPHPEQNNFSILKDSNGARTDVRRSPYKVSFLESYFNQIRYMSTNFSINP